MGKKKIERILCNMLETNKFKKRKRSSLQSSLPWLNSSSNREKEDNRASVLSEEPPSPVPSHVSSNEEKMNEKVQKYEKKISDLKSKNKDLKDQNKQLIARNKRLLAIDEKKGDVESTKSEIDENKSKSVAPMTKKSNISSNKQTIKHLSNTIPENQKSPSKQETLEDIEAPSKPLIKTRKIRFADEELKKMPVFRKIFRFDSEERASNKNGTEVENFLHWDCPLIAGIPGKVVIFRDMIPTIECEEAKISISVTMTPAEPDDTELAVNVKDVKPKIIPF